MLAGKKSILRRESYGFLTGRRLFGSSSGPHSASLRPAAQIAEHGLREIAENLHATVVIQHEEADIDKLPRFPAFAH
jgi:hypothetical protein